MKFKRQRNNWGGKNNPNWRGGKTRIPCAHCGADVFRYSAEAKKRESSGKKTFCSPGCHNDFRRKPASKSVPHVGENHWRWRGERYCAICNKELISSGERKSTICGSKRCLSSLRSKQNRGEKNGRFKKGVVVRCRVCRKEINHRNRLIVKTCSRKCGGVWYSKNYTGKNSPHYKDDKVSSKYGQEWTPSLRKEVRKRDGFACRICGKKGKSLDVHHIDENKLNCDTSNLISLCRSCHRKVHGGSEKVPALGD